MEFFRFIWRHPLGAFIAVVGAAMTVGGLISDAYSFIHLGLPPMVWAAIGAALFMGALVWMLYRWEARLPPTAAPDVIFPLPAKAEFQTYDGAHERLMTFVVEHLFSACYARERLHGNLIRALCPNGPVAEIAELGATHHSNAWEYRTGLDGLEGLSNSPADFIPFPEMIESVALAEKGYEAFLNETNRLAESGYIRPSCAPQLAKYWDEWRVAHNAMVTAYEAIKRDSKMGELFRPVRESRWGGVVPAATGAVPLPLMLRDTE